MGDNKDDRNKADEPQRWSSRSDALNRHPIPFENRALVERITDAISIEGYYDAGAHIRAVRNDGEKPLHIAYGWTNGFVSKEEARHAAGDVTIDPSSRNGLWVVIHPINKIYGAAESSTRGTPRDHGVCEVPACGMTPPASGLCDLHS